MYYPCEKKNECSGKRGGANCLHNNGKPIWSFNFTYNFVSTSSASEHVTDDELNQWICNAKYEPLGENSDLIDFVRYDKRVLEKDVTFWGWKPFELKQSFRSWYVV